MIFSDELNLIEFIIEASLNIYTNSKIDTRTIMWAEGRKRAKLSLLVIRFPIELIYFCNSRNYFKNNRISVVFHYSLSFVVHVFLT